MDCWSEMKGKMVHDNLEMKLNRGRGRCFLVPGPVIVGAGPSGLATAACLKDRGVPSVILERDECIASLWQLKTYDRLRLHIPKHFCELPLMPYPASYPTYPDKEQFLDYMNSYVKAFDLKPVFNETVKNAEFDHSLGLWRVKTVGLNHQETEYVCRWLVVATGENAEAVMPEIEGLAEFDGPKLHTSVYKNGHHYKGKKVLVIGCGNSGMEVCVDLCNYNARPCLVVRDAVHVLPQEMLGRSTFGLSMFLSKWFSVRMVDRFLLLVSRFILGDTSRLGLHRPAIGPLELKGMTGKTPVLDVGTLSKIRAGEIEVRRAVKRVTRHAVEFVDGKVEDFDAIVLATGYKSNVPTWLKERDLFEENGYPKKPFPHGWKGENGLYTVGFSKRGLLGASMDATKIAQDIETCWKAESKHLTSFASPPPPTRPPQSS